MIVIVKIVQKPLLFNIYIMCASCPSLVCCDGIACCPFEKVLIFQLFSTYFGRERLLCT